MKAVLNENLNRPKSRRNYVWFLWGGHFCFKECCFNESCWQWFLWQLSIICRSIVSWYISIQCPKSFVFYIHQLKVRKPKTLFGNLDLLNLSLGTCLGHKKLRSHIIVANILTGVVKMDDAFTPKTYTLKSNHFNSRWLSALPSPSTRLRILIIDFL